jgi:hypothetical protein
MTTISSGAGRALTQLVEHAAPFGDDTARAVASGRPTSIFSTISVEAGKHGIPRTDAPALAVFDQTFRIGPPTAADGLLELRLPHEAMMLMSARSGGRELATTVKGTQLLIRHPGEGELSLRLAMESAPDRPLQFQVDRVLLDDVAARIERGAETVAPPLHFRTGEPQPDVTQHVVRFDERGWEVTSPAKETLAKYVHPLTETVQSHFQTPRADPFTATANYSGRVNGGPKAEGPIADARRAGKGLMYAIGGRILQTIEP